MKHLFWLFLVLLIATAWHRSEHFDDAWFAEQAYWLVHDGRVRSAFFQGLNGWENQLFVFHKGFIYFGAALQGLFGFSLPVGKAVGAFWTLVGGLAVWQQVRWLGLATRWGYLALLVYIANGMLIEYAFVNRPEPMYATLGFVSFLLLVRGRTAGAGLLAGLAVLTHLNGLCFVLAGLGWLGWQQRGHGLRPALRFGLTAAASSGLYFADVLLANQLPMFWAQFTDDPATSHMTSLTDKLLISSKLHELFFHSEEEATMSALVMGVAVLTYWPWPRTRPEPIDGAAALAGTGRYLLLLVLAFVLITKSNTDYYYLIFLPVMCVWVAQCVASWSATGTSPVMVQWRSYGLGLLLGVYLLAGAYKAVITIRSNFEQPDVVEKNARLAALIQQPGARIIAPLDFFYDQQERYHIHGLSYYYLLNQKTYGGQMTVDQFFQLADADSAAAVISDYGRDFSYPIKKDAPARVGRYRRVYQDEWNAVYLLLKRPENIVPHGR